MPHRLVEAHKMHKEAAAHIKDYVSENHPDMVDQLHEDSEGHETAGEGTPDNTISHKSEPMGHGTEDAGHDGPKAGSSVHGFHVKKKGMF